MHPEQIRVGMWLRIEDVMAYRPPAADDPLFAHSYQFQAAQHYLGQFGGMPVQVVAFQYPFCLVNTGPRGLLMVDLRFNRMGKCDEKFVNAVKRLRERSLAAQLSVQPEEPMEAGEDGDDPGKISTIKV